MFRIMIYHIIMQPGEDILLDKNTSCETANICTAGKVWDLNLPEKCSKPWFPDLDIRDQEITSLSPTHPSPPKKKI